MTARIVPSALLVASTMLALPVAADLQVPLTTPAARKAATDSPSGKAPAGKTPAGPGAVPKRYVVPDALRRPTVSRGALASRSMPAGGFRPSVSGGVPSLPPADGSVPAQPPAEVDVQAWLGKILAPQADTYRLPDAHSDWVARLKSGQQVAIVSQWQGWFAILMNDGSQAYVPQAYVEVQPYRVKSVEAPQSPAPAPQPARQGSAGGYGQVSGNPMAQAVIQAAFRYEGVPYVYGGNTEKGIDCSGLVKNCFAECGVNLPRQAHLQAEVGQPVQFDQLQPGDRLYFSVKKTYDHTGIYLGNGYFIHAAMSRHKVGVDHLSTPLYGGHLAAARR